jgi:hypothetical protein
LELASRRHFRQGELVPETKSQEWFWITTLPAANFPIKQVWALGHARWENESGGWSDLTQNWAPKRGFLHACRHRRTTASSSGQRQPLANRGLAAVVLILRRALALFYASAILHSKIYRLHHPPLIAIARQIHRSLWRFQPPAGAPTPSAADRRQHTVNHFLDARTPPQPSGQACCRFPRPTTASLAVFRHPQHQTQAPANLPAFSNRHPARFVALQTDSATGHAKSLGSPRQSSAWLKSVC